MTAASQPACESDDILEALPSAVLVFEDELVTYANPRAAEVLGVSRARLLGMDARSVFGADVGALEDNELGEHTVQRPGRAELTIGFTASRPRCGGTAVVFQDISRYAKLRAERDRLLSMAAIGDALPSLLHELKNPLAAIGFSVEVLIEELPDGDIREQLYAILSEVRRMRLGFEGIGAVHNELRHARDQPIDLACREACRILEGQAQAKGVALRVEVATMPLLPLDPAVVRAMVFNFVTNSLHACEGGGTVRVRAGYRREATEGTFELVVTDDGTGMTPDVVTRCTELFFTTKASGSGAGLALCQRVVERAGGTLSIRSVPGFGTSVTVRVPIGVSSRREGR